MLLRISGDEYRSRFEALQSGVRQADLDVFVVSSSDSLYYLTGVSNPWSGHSFFWPGLRVRLA